MSDMLVTLLTYYSTHKARYLKIRLEVVGVECYLSNGNKSNSSKGIQVQVMPEDVEKAINVILLIKDEHLEGSIKVPKDIK